MLRLQVQRTEEGCSTLTKAQHNPRQSTEHESPHLAAQGNRLRSAAPELPSPTCHMIVQPGRCSKEKQTYLVKLELLMKRTLMEAMVPSNPTRANADAAVHSH